MVIICIECMCTMLSAEFWIIKVDYLVGPVLTRSFLPVFQRRSRWRRCTGCVMFVDTKFEQTALDSAHVIKRRSRSCDVLWTLLVRGYLSCP